MQVSDYRRENLRRYIDTNGGPVEVARRLGYSAASYLVQMTGPNPTRPVSERTARAFEEKLGLEPGSLDQAVAVTEQPESIIARRRRAALGNFTPQPAALSAEQVGELIQMVGRVCEDENATLPTPKFADIVALALLDSAAHGGQPRAEYIQTLVRLTR